MSTVRPLLAVACAAAMGVGPLSASAHATDTGMAWSSSPVATEQTAAHPPWICGIGDDKHKLLEEYPANLKLRCGTEGWGFRHIRTEHLKDFQRLTAFTSQHWQDIVHIAIHKVTSTNLVGTPSGVNKTCRSQVIYLQDKRRKTKVREQIVKVISGSDNKNIITAFPSRTPC